MKSANQDRKALRKESRKNKKQQKKVAYENFHNAPGVKKTTKMKPNKVQSVKGVKKIIKNAQKQNSPSQPVRKNQVNGKAKESKATTSNGLQFSNNNLSSRMAALQSFINNETKGSAHNTDDDDNNEKTQIEKKKRSSTNKINGVKKSKLEKGMEHDTKEINEMQRQLKLNAKQKKSKKMLSNVFGDDISELFDVLDYEPGKDIFKDEGALDLPEIITTKKPKIVCQVPENAIKVDTSKQFFEEDDIPVNYEAKASQAEDKKNSKPKKRKRIPIEFEYEQEEDEEKDIPTPIIKKSRSKNKKNMNISFSLEDTKVRLIPTIEKQSGFVVEDKEARNIYFDVDQSDVPKFLSNESILSLCETDSDEEMDLYQRKAKKRIINKSHKKLLNGTNKTSVESEDSDEEFSDLENDEHYDFDDEEGNESIDDESIDDESIDDESIDDESIDDESIDDESMDNESMDEEDNFFMEDYNGDSDDIHMEAELTDEEEGSGDDIHMEAEMTDSEEEVAEVKASTNTKKMVSQAVGEDIYGRSVDSEGNIVTSEEMPETDGQLQEQLNTPQMKKVKVQLRGRLNRLAEVNLPGTVTMVSLVEPLMGNLMTVETLVLIVNDCPNMQLAIFKRCFLLS